MKNESLVIREFEEILNGSRELDEEHVNRTMFQAYLQGKESGNARLDFNDIIWDKDIQPIAETVRRLGIKVQGIVKVNSRFHVSYDESKEHEVIPAFLMNVESR